MKGHTSRVLECEIMQEAPHNYIQPHIQSHTHAHAHVHKHTAHIHHTLHTHTHTHAHTRTYTHTHAHTFCQSADVTGTYLNSSTFVLLALVVK